MRYIWFTFLTTMLFISAAQAAELFPQGVFEARSDGQDPNDPCSHYLSVELFQTPDANWAYLKDGISEMCEFHVEPSPRAYELYGERNECGSIIYSGSRVTFINGEVRFEFQDNSRRSCKDIRPGMYEFHEIYSDGSKVSNYYSGR